MSALQQTHGLELKPGHVAQYSLKKCINNATNSATYEWCTGTVTKASDGSSLVNDGNGRFYSKGWVLELQWHDDADIGEDIRFTIEKIYKTKFNRHVQTG